MSPQRDRVFVASVAFFLAFGTVRLITHAIRHDVGPFHNVGVGGTHIHHLVWGILGLLLVGYLWLAQVGTGQRHGPDPWLSRLTSALFGISAALTLDEFALWFNLADVYWQRQGRESVDAVILFGSALSAGWLAVPFLRAAGRELGSLFGSSR